MRIGRKILATAAIGGLIALLSGCSSSSIPGFGFKKDLSSVNQISISLWQFVVISIIIVGVFTFVLIMWPIFFHRKKSEEFPKQTQYNIPVEVAYTVIPFVIVAVLFFLTAKDESKITHITPVSKVAHVIDVNAYQWSWQFTYADTKLAAKDSTVTGTPAQPPTLVLPQGERVQFVLTSSDVVHGFWIPAFMIQMQNLPGVTNHLEFSAEKLGTYPGRCNILCGRNHSQMLFKVKVVTPAEYQSYLATFKAA